MDHEHWYSTEEIEELLRRALSLGFTLEKGSILEGMTVEDLERLVKYKI